MAPDVGALRGRVNELEEEREELLCKLEQYAELKAKNGNKKRTYCTEYPLHLIIEIKVA